MMTLALRVRPLSCCALGVAISLGLGVQGVEAQQQVPAPPPPAVVAAPALLRPSAAPPPTAPVAAQAANRTPTAAPVRPMQPGSALPPDSVRPAPVAVSTPRPAPVASPPPAPVAAAPTAVRAAVAPPSAPPAGASMHCKDGTYLTGTAAPGRCDANGGVAAVLPAAKQTPPPPSVHRTP
jgi:hypothetical protein